MLPNLQGGCLCGKIRFSASLPSGIDCFVGARAPKDGKPEQPYRHEHPCMAPAAGQA